MTSIGSPTAGTFLAPYKFSFANVLLAGSLNAAGTKLTVSSWTEFTDNSGRANYSTTETLVPFQGFTRGGRTAAGLPRSSPR